MDALNYDPETGTYRTAFDPATVAPSVAIATVLTDICGDERTQREPLYEVVDGDALDQLYAKDGDGRSGGEVTVEFTYLDYEVRLDGDGEVEIRPPSDGTADRANQ